MRPQYLLPCSCGKKIPIETPQAGQDVSCECGAVIEAPTLMGIRALERLGPAEVPASARRRKRWGVRQRILLLGVLLVVIGIGSTAYAVLARPAQTDAETREESEAYVMVLEDFNTLTVSHSWDLWQFLREGVRPTPTWQSQYTKLVRRNNLFMGISIFVIVLGIGTIVGSRMIPDQRRRRVVKRAQPKGAK